MKTISGALLAHIQGTTLTICTCWKITRTDGEILGFTDHTSDLTVDSVLYKAQSGYTRSAISSSIDLSVDNLELEGLIDGADITDSDLRGGKYDYAAIQIFIVNYKDLTQGIMILKSGTFGELAIKNNIYVAEFRGLSQKLSRELGDIYTPDCRFDLGDADCTFDLSDTDYNYIGDRIDTVTGVNSFICNNAGDPAGAGATWKHGYVEWTDPAEPNYGKKYEIKAWNSGTKEITLFMPTAYAMTAGDHFDLYVGCDKTPTQCHGVFNNIINFGGFQFMPSVRWVLRYPDAIMAAIAGQNDDSDN